MEFSISVTCVEIYNERLRCLITHAGEGATTRECVCQIVEHPTKGIIVSNARHVYVGTAEELASVVHEAHQRRITEATRMNEMSSRGHFLSLVTLNQQDGSTGADDKNSTLYLVDLAGSEKASKTKAEGQQLEEAKHINQSLLTLGMVIAGLSGDRGGRGHLPYRDSKLTRLLQNAFGGNSRTSLVLCISLDPSNKSESLSTLRFGSNAGRITNHAKINTMPTVEKLQAALSEAQREIEILRDGSAMMPLVNLYEIQVKELQEMNRHWKQEYASLLQGVSFPPQLAAYSQETQRLRDECGTLKMQLQMMEMKVKSRDEKIEQLRNSLKSRAESADVAVGFALNVSGPQIIKMLVNR